MSTYDKASNSYLRGKAVTPQASVTQTATTTGAAVAVDGATARLELAVTAHAGTTPTLDVKLQHSKDGSTAWTDVTGGAFAQVTTTNGVTRKVFTGLDRFIRVVATIAGTTPSYTYSVSGEAL